MKKSPLFVLSLLAYAWVSCKEVLVAYPMHGGAFDGHLSTQVVCVSSGYESIKETRTDAKAKYISVIFSGVKND